MNITMLLTNAFEMDVRVYKEASYLIEQGNRVTILCWDRNKDSKLKAMDSKDNIDIVRFKEPSVAGSGYKQAGAFLRYALKCKKYLKEHQTDYVHCNDLDGMMAYQICGKRKPYVFDMHEYYMRGGKFKQKIIKGLVGYFIKNSHYSLYENDGYLKLYPESVTKHLVPLKNYPDGKCLQPLEKTSSEMFRIGYHGCVRGQIPEFKALFEACKDMTDVRIDINGGGIDLEELNRMQEKYENVFVHGPYDGIRESNRLYQNTDVLFCGYNPNNPNYQGDAEVVKFYEAIVTGTPMIMTETLGMGDKVRKMQIGITADTREAEDVKKAVLFLKENEKKCQEFRENMLQISSIYKWEEAVKVLDKVYEI